MDDCTEVEVFEEVKSHKARHRRGLHHNGPKGKPWTITVDVYLNNVDDPNAPDFDIRTCVETVPGDAKHPTIVFNNYERSGFDISFRLWDNTGNTFTFPQDETEAVWSQTGSCPRGPKGVWDVLQPKKVSADGLTLSVHNPNDLTCPLGYFYYTLRVTDGTDWIQLDPGGVNNNGNSTY